MISANCPVADLPAAKRKLLAELLEKEGITPFATQVIQPLKSGQGALSFAQQRLWLFEQVHPGSTAYNDHLALRILGSLNVGALESCLSEIVRRHEVLRTTYVFVDGRPQTLSAAAQTVILPLVNLRD